MELRALKQKLLYMQTTIDTLTKPQPKENSDIPPETQTSNWRSFKRSRSFQSFSSGSVSPPICYVTAPPVVYERKYGLQPESLKLDFSDSSFDASAASSRKDSQRSSFSIKLDAVFHHLKVSEDYHVTSSQSGRPMDKLRTPSLLEEAVNSSNDAAQVDEILKPISGDNVIAKNNNAGRLGELFRASFVESVASGNNTPPVEEILKPDPEEKPLDSVLHSEPTANRSLDIPADQSVRNDASVASDDLPSRFERFRCEIVELWESCNVPLLHRTYFFLLFNGDPSDAIYMEVELRRLKYLRDKLSKSSRNANDDHSLSMATSLRAINSEREILVRLMLKRISEKERVDLYKKWGIELRSKRRKAQLVQRLRKDTKDITHIQESADAVAKLVGITQAPKEMFGLRFSPAPVARSSLSWRHRRLSFE